MAVRVDPLLPLRLDTDFTVLTLAPEIGGVAPPLRPQEWPQGWCHIACVHVATLSSSFS